MGAVFQLAVIRLNIINNRIPGINKQIASSRFNNKEITGIIIKAISDHGPVSLENNFPKTNNNMDRIKSSIHWERPINIPILVANPRPPLNYIYKDQLWPIIDAKAMIACISIS